MNYKTLEFLGGSSKEIPDYTYDERGFVVTCLSDGVDGKTKENYVYDADGKLLRHENIIDYTKTNILGEFADLQGFIRKWNDEEKKDNKEEEKEIEPEKLEELEKMQKVVDQFKETFIFLTRKRRKHLRYIFQEICKNSGGYLEENGLAEYYRNYYPMDDNKAIADAHKFIEICGQSKIDDQDKTSITYEDFIGIGRQFCGDGCRRQTADSCTGAFKGRSEHQGNWPYMAYE